MKATVCLWIAAASFAAISLPSIEAKPRAQQRTKQDGGWSIANSTLESKDDRATLQVDFTPEGTHANGRWSFGPNGTKYRSGKRLPELIPTAVGVQYIVHIHTPARYFPPVPPYREVKLSADKLTEVDVEFGSMTKHPASQSVPLGQQVMFTVEVNNPTELELRYRWQYRRKTYHNWSDIANATKDTYTIASTTDGPAGHYRVVVRREDNASLSSNSARLTLTK